MDASLCGRDCGLMLRSFFLGLVWLVYFLCEVGMIIIVDEFSFALEPENVIQLST